ncbi:biotin-acetyl-CoA-carboxylase ligase [Wolbachia endosymbiont of Armadillidium vulgare str. wVulC]|nr:biotin-acetyl-CoA-carboxylase ligase [Wolbachia endosymbiont of Armadillidium vulgare str. wVulC]
MIPEGFHIHHYKEVSSTNREALDLIDKGISNETIIIADKQTEGRGRTGKNWISPEGNFYASLVVNLFNNYLDKSLLSVSFQRVTLESRNKEAWSSTGMTSDDTGITVGLTSQVKDISKLTELTFVTALAVGNTLLSFVSDSNIQHKWPNDILIDDKKISGILLEKRSNSNWLIVGIGINVNHAPLPGTTCISNYGESVSNIDLLEKLIINLIS